MVVHDRWTFNDGLGAMIVSPTRELALQIFEVLRKVGGHHQLSAGLITGYAYAISSAYVCIMVFVYTYWHCIIQYIVQWQYVLTCYSKVCIASLF
jgi:hypothetical protein